MSTHKKSAPRHISVSEFKSKALGIFSQLEGTSESIIVTRRGQPIATVMPFKSESVVATAGTLKHLLVDCDDVLNPVATSDWDALK